MEMSNGERYMTIIFQDILTIKMIGGVRNSLPAITGSPFGSKRCIYSPLSLAQILIIGETSPIPGVDGVDKFSYSTLWELFEKDLNKPSE